jgi:hypothetical protein
MIIKTDIFDRGVLYWVSLRTGEMAHRSGTENVPRTERPAVSVDSDGDRSALISPLIDFLLISLATVIVVALTGVVIV